MTELQFLKSTTNHEIYSDNYYLLNNVVLNFFSVKKVAKRAKKFLVNTFNANRFILHLSKSLIFHVLKRCKKSCCHEMC